MGISTNVLWPH